MPIPHDVDWNLLRVLDALLVERHLTRAGARLGMSQSATSHALARLRLAFGDPLFVRAARGLAPTPRAVALAESVREAVNAVGRVLHEEPAFAPATAQRRFTIASSDFGSFVLAPALLAQVARTAPGVDVWFRSFGASPFDPLVRGEADVLVHPAGPGDVPAGIRTRPLIRERFVCLVRKGHPRVKRTIDLDTWTSLRHVLIAPRGRPGGIVDDLLAQLGRRRRVVMAVPHFLLAPHLVAGSDAVLTLGSRIAEAFVKLLPLRVVEPPVALPTFEERMYWHERNHRDPAQQWFRETIRAAV